MGNDGLRRMEVDVLIGLLDSLPALVAQSCRGGGNYRLKGLRMIIFIYLVEDEMKKKKNKQRVGREKDNGYLPHILYFKVDQMNPTKLSLRRAGEIKYARCRHGSNFQTQFLKVK